jgi:hypothetical protein
MHTPGLPESRAQPEAACPAFCSCRTKIWRMPLPSRLSNSGQIAAPGYPNTVSIPSACKAFTIASLARIIRSPPLILITCYYNPAVRPKSIQGIFVD